MARQDARDAEERRILDADFATQQLNAANNAARPAALPPLIQPQGVGDHQAGINAAAAAWRGVGDRLRNLNLNAAQSNAANVNRGGRRRTRRHRTRKSRRRGGYDETKTRRRHIAKLMLEEASRRRRAAKNQAEMARLVEARRRYAEGRKA